MEYLYGEFSYNQIQTNASRMHNEIHKLLLYKDTAITETIFNSESDFLNYFDNLLFRFGGLNKLLGEPDHMVSLMSTLQAAHDEVCKVEFNYRNFRKLILNAHGFITMMFEEVDSCQA